MSFSSSHLSTLRFARSPVKRTPVRKPNQNKIRTEGSRQKGKRERPAPQKKWTTIYFGRIFRSANTYPRTRDIWRFSTIRCVNYWFLFGSFLYFPFQPPSDFGPEVLLSFALLRRTDVVPAVKQIPAQLNPMLAGNYKCHGTF